MQRRFILIGSFLAALAVILGAFAAHGLKAELVSSQLVTFETGVRYHFYHSFAILIVGALMRDYSSSLLPKAGYAFMAGIILFSGSLYLLATKSLLGIESWTWLGPITPLGGTFFIIGWGLIFVAASSSE